MGAWAEMKSKEELMYGLCFLIMQWLKLAWVF